MRHPLLSTHGSTVFLLGNEAIARGAIEAGIGFASAYPGTPSTEIIESLAEVAKDFGFYVEWSVNEKVAFEAAYGASISGIRSLTAMKHVGLNVASDALMSSAYTGVEAGFVIVSAEDPDMWSSQNEQDNRYYGLHAYIPVFETYSPQEAKELVKYSFDFSEKFRHPIIFRSTTRLSHCRGPVKFDEVPEIRVNGRFERNIRFSLLPANARRLRIKLLEKWRNICEEVNHSPFNNYVDNGSRKLIICSGTGYGYVYDCLKILKVEDKVDLLKISTVVPFPRRLILKALEGCDEVLVVEELEPILERDVKVLAFEEGLKCRIHGKDIVPLIGELSVNKLIDGISKFMGLPIPLNLNPPLESKVEIPERPPILCAGCPHRATFLELKWALAKSGVRDVVFCGDIGCYSLGANPPFHVQDIILEMGGGIGSANGISHVSNQFIISIMGDSTFYHACIPGLINTIYNNSSMLILVLDNRVTAMTGHQPHPGSGRTAMGYGVNEVKIEDIALGIGIKHVKTIDPFNVKDSIEELIKAIKYVLENRSVALINSRRACTLMAVSNARSRGVEIPTYFVDEELCKACGICYNQLSCPAIIPMENKRAYIDPYLCFGCSVCMQICPFNAIKPYKLPSKDWENIWRLN
ncbi:MAG: indolepyruvate ferredoxin oxidoreductase subunit alpha [Candidatus Methanomethylicia archaeon]